MKKTLERLKKDALRDADACLKVFESSWKGIDKMTEEEKELLSWFTEYVPRAIIRLLRYIQALEDYGYELDEEWDSYLGKIKKMEKAVKEMSPKKKEGKKKPSYRV